MERLKYKIGMITTHKRRIITACLRIRWSKTSQNIIIIIIIITIAIIVVIAIAIIVIICSTVCRDAIIFHDAQI
jgi:hypothetical protein